jgi:S1-C subfamily serine protease
VAGGADNIGFAIAIDAVRPLLERLREGRVAFLGVSSVDVDTVPTALLDRFGVDPGRDGAFVREASPGTPAAAAGLRQGDVVTGVDGESIESASDLVDAITSREPGTRVTVTFQRSGTERTVELELDVRSLTGD